MAPTWSRRVPWEQGGTGGKCSAFNQRPGPSRTVAGGPSLRGGVQYLRSRLRAGPSGDGGGLDVDSALVLNAQVDVIVALERRRRSEAPRSLRTHRLTVALSLQCHTHSGESNPLFTWLVSGGWLVLLHEV